MTYQKQTYRRLPELSPEEQEALNEKIKLFFEKTDQVIESKK